MTQCERIKRHLEDYGSITSLEAVNEYGILRLAARVSDLKAQGLDISDKFESSKNRYGETVSYKRYFLRREMNGGAENIQA